MMSDPLPDWRPACSLPMLRARADMLASVRQFFTARGYLEVETPCLSRDVVVDAWLEPLKVRQGEQDWYLQTSPEAFMKRLLAAGAGSIFQISRVFRAGECGARHNPEFTMLEWYGVGTDWRDQLWFTEQLVREVVLAGCRSLGRSQPAWGSEQFALTTYAEAFKRELGLAVFAATDDELLAAAQARGIPIPGGQAMVRDELLNLLLGFCIEAGLGQRSGQERPEFLCDYPASQAALAVTTETAPAVARRFELYIRGLELCNGYQELTDPAELRRRDQRQNETRACGAGSVLPGAKQMLRAMEHGLPACSGVALGFDRLVMVAAGSDELAEVLPFPAARC
ncbi:MAG: EF-P lysine aminoacylase EpmA [Planctomycetaceae bacterium]